MSNGWLSQVDWEFAFEENFEQDGRIDLGFYLNGLGLVCEKGWVGGRSEARVTPKEKKKKERKRKKLVGVDQHLINNITIHHLVLLSLLERDQ